MAPNHPFQFPVVLLLAALLSTGCMQSPQAAERSTVVQGVNMQAGSGSCANRADESTIPAAGHEPRAQGLALRRTCTGNVQQGNLQLVVPDSVRASEVLRGPLADGEPVDVGTGPNVSPDVQYNRDWLEQALRSHTLQAAGAEPTHVNTGPLQPVDFAAR